MKNITKNSIVSFLKRILLVALVVFVATFLQFYWSMGKLSDRISSSCLECWFVEDAFKMSLITAVFLLIIFKFISSINKVLKIITQFLLLISVWFFWDFTIFVERESSWSTYLFNEELYYVATFSTMPILVLSFVTIFVINSEKIIKNDKVL